MVITALQRQARLVQSHSLSPHLYRASTLAANRLHEIFFSSSSSERSTDGGDVAVKEAFFRHFHSDDHFRGQAVYSLSFSGEALENDLASDDDCPLIDDRMKRQIRLSYSTLKMPSNYNARVLRSRLPPKLDLENLEPISIHGEGEVPLPHLEDDLIETMTVSSTYHMPLPKSINDIAPSKLDDDIRAIVVTDTNHPFRITDVNAAWEGLCGYNREDAKGRSLGALLQGPDTDGGAVTALLAKLLSGEEAGTLLTNYTKSGRKFRNDLRVGPVVDEMGKTVRFVGILREVKPDPDLDQVSSGGDIGYESKRGKVQLPFMS